MAYEKVADILRDRGAKQVNLRMQVQKDGTEMGIELEVGSEIRSIVVEEPSTDIVN